MLRSEIPRELDLAPPNAAGKQAEGKPLLAVYERKVRPKDARRSRMGRGEVWALLG